jgi:hypothetical protein
MFHNTRHVTDSSAITEAERLATTLTVFIKYCSSQFKSSIQWQVLHPQGGKCNRSVLGIRLIALTTEAVTASEATVNFYQTTWHNFPEDSHLNTGNSPDKSWQMYRCAMQMLSMKLTMHTLQQDSHSHGYMLQQKERCPHCFIYSTLTTASVLCLVYSSVTDRLRHLGSYTIVHFCPHPVQLV